VPPGPGRVLEATPRGRRVPGPRAVRPPEPPRERRRLLPAEWVLPGLHRLAAILGRLYTRPLRGAPRHAPRRPGREPGQDRGVPRARAIEREPGVPGCRPGCRRVPRDVVEARGDLRRLRSRARVGRSRAEVPGVAPGRELR